MFKNMVSNLCKYQKFAVRAGNSKTSFFLLSLAKENEPICKSDANRENNVTGTEM